MEQEMQALLETLLRLINDATFIPFAAPLVVLLVAIAKRIPLEQFGLARINPAVTALFLQVVLWVGYMLARRFGAEFEFEQGIAAIGQILEGLLLLLPAFAGAAWATPKIYDAFQRANVPVLGYKRT